MIEHIKQKLLLTALEAPFISGKYRLAAGVVYKRRLVAVGVAQYKTHPCMMNGAYRKEQVYLHAESDALVRASRLLTPAQMACSVVYVVRVLKDGSEALAKPCNGCMALISQYGITKVEYTSHKGGIG